MAWKQRQHPRYKAAVSVELRPKDAPTPLRTQTADIGLGGCYVETNFTEEISTPVEITLWVGDSKVSVAGEVVSKHPSFGNGYKFIRLAKEGEEALDRYLQTLKPQGLLMEDPPPPDNPESKK